MRYDDDDDLRNQSGFLRVCQFSNVQVIARSKVILHSSTRQIRGGGSVHVVVQMSIKTTPARISIRTP